MGDYMVQLLWMVSVGTLPCSTDNIS